MKYFKHIRDGQTQYFRPDTVGTNICIPEDEINTDYARMMEEVAASTSTIEEVDDTPVLTYADNRRRAFAKIGDQLDMQYHDAVDGTTTWKDHIKAVKDANPKP